jgi:hypothetical protein
MRPCWMLEKRDVCFVALGKHGDLAIALPMFKAVADEMGKPPIVIVSDEFASTLEGASYVRPWVVNYHWWRGVGPARKLAESVGLRATVLKFWDEPGHSPPTPLGPGRKITLTIHGQQRVVNAEDWDSYQSSQWRYAGFTVEQMMSWPLVFDRRNPQRESFLRAKVFKTNLPKMLVNCNASGTSPFKWNNLVMSMVANIGFEVIDLAKIRAHYIFDLLGLYDYSAGMITSDTATLHLAAASKIPYIAFINDGGAGSVPRGNCILSVRYSELSKRKDEVIQAINKIRK